MDPDEALERRERVTEGREADAERRDRETDMTPVLTSVLTPREEAERHAVAAARSLQAALVVLRNPEVVDGAAEIREAVSEALNALEELEIERGWSLDKVSEPLERIREVLDAGPRFAPVELDDFVPSTPAVAARRAAVRAALRWYGIEAESGALDAAIAAAETGV